jgi:3-deoxy-D-arabino-heptulosonate 7-phosphate (DAHP) synthase
MSDETPTAVEYLRSAWGRVLVMARSGRVEVAAGRGEDDMPIVWMAPSEARELADMLRTVADAAEAHGIPCERYQPQPPAPMTDRERGMRLAVAKMRELGKNEHGAAVGADGVTWRVHRHDAGACVDVWEVRVTDGVAIERSLWEARV